MATGSLVSLNSTAKVVLFLLAGVNYSSSFYKISRFMPRYLVTFRTHKNIRRNAYRGTETADDGLVVNETDNAVVKSGQIAREREELLVVERLEVVFCRLKHNGF